MNIDEDEIEGIEQLTNIFQRFPSFHDAEVVTLTLSSGNYTAHVTLEAVIHVFEMTSEVAGGSYIFKNHTLVTFEFDHIVDLQLEGFAHQNCLQDLSIVNIKSQGLEDIKFEVGFLGIVGLEATFKCRAIHILSAVPFIPRGPYAPKDC